MNRARLIDVMLLGGPAVLVLSAALLGGAYGLVVYALTHAVHWPRWPEDARS